VAGHKSRIIWSPEALDDIDSLWVYYAGTAGRTTADKILREVDKIVATIDDFPLSGRSRDEIRAGLRSLAASLFALHRAGLSSLIISAVAGYYETGTSVGSERYESLLVQFFKITIVVAAVALTFDVVAGMFVGLLIGSSQLTLTSAILMARFLHLPVRFYIVAILASLVLFVVLAMLNWVAAWHFYYPLLALLSTACTTISLRGYKRWKGEGSYGK